MRRDFTRAGEVISRGVAGGECGACRELRFYLHGSHGWRRITARSSILEGRDPRGRERRYNQTNKFNTQGARSAETKPRQPWESNVRSMAKLASALGGGTRASPVTLMTGRVLKGFRARKRRKSPETSLVMHLLPRDLEAKETPVSGSGVACVPSFERAFTSVASECDSFSSPSQ